MRVVVPGDARAGVALSIVVITANEIELDGGSITVKEKPTIQQVRGRYHPNQKIELSGTGLGDAGKVLIDGNEVSNVDWQSEHITVPVPDEVRKGARLPVVVITADRTELEAGSITVQEEATVEPASSEYAPGDRVELRGSGLGEEGKVYLDGRDAWCGVET
jgi:hypothetical protein